MIKTMTQTWKCSFSSFLWLFNSFYWYLLHFRNTYTLAISIQIFYILLPFFFNTFCVCCLIWSWNNGQVLPYFHLFKQSFKQPALLCYWLFSFSLHLLINNAQYALTLNRRNVNKPSFTFHWSCFLCSASSWQFWVFPVQLNAAYLCRSELMSDMNQCLWLLGFPLDTPMWSCLAYIKHCQKSGTTSEKNDQKGKKLQFSF